MKSLQPLTIFHYVEGPELLHESAWPVSDMSVLVAILAVSTVLGGVIWSRRDLPL